MKRHFVLLAMALAACKGKENGPTELGPPASMSVSPTAPTAPANTDLTGVTLTVRDANNNALPDQVVTFTVTAGGGSLAATTATTGPNGTVTVPAWRLGKLDVPQTVQATTGGVNFNINASVQTSYRVVLRYFGGGNPTPAQQAMFDRAAARIQAVITGDVANVQTPPNFDISPCTPGTTTRITEMIDDVVIYVRIAEIDGPGNIIASAGPCFVRQVGGPDSLTTVIGTMNFDSADIGILREETILHEMLHVIGFGAMWPDPPPDGWGLVTNVNGPNPRYTGAHGTQGCREIGGTVTCATSVPVEDTLGPGTRDTHWAKDEFANELMTGFIEPATVPMPMSIMTVRSLRDIGYTVNLANFDTFTKPFNALRADGPRARRVQWEGPPPVPVFAIDLNGNIIRQLRKGP